MRHSDLDGDGGALRVELSLVVLGLTEVEAAPWMGWKAEEDGGAEGPGGE